MVESRGGAGGLTGVDAAAKSAPDGYTVCLAGAAALSAIPFMLSRMPFDWQKDLALLTLVVRVPEVLTVQPALGLNSFADFVAYVSERKFFNNPVGIGDAVLVTWPVEVARLLR